MNEYKIGDIANGHVLTEQGWVPVPQDKPKKTHKGLIVAGVVVGLAFVVGAIGGSPSEDTSTASEPTATQSAPVEAPAPVETAEPLTGKALIKDVAGEGSKVVKEGSDLSVFFPISDNLTTGLIKTGFYRDAKDILEAVQQSGLKVTSVTIWGTFPLQDKYGNDLGPKNVMNVGFEDVNRLNLENLYGEDDLVGASDFAFVHPAFR